MNDCFENDEYLKDTEKQEFKGFGNGKRKKKNTKKLKLIETMPYKDEEGSLDEHILSYDTFTTVIIEGKLVGK